MFEKIFKMFDFEDEMDIDFFVFKDVIFFFSNVVKGKCSVVNFLVEVEDSFLWYENCFFFYFI